MPAQPPRDATRVYAGFTTFDRGMDSGSAASLIPVNQYAAANNITVRGDYAEVRPPWRQVPLTIDASVAARLTGKFQGAMWYDGELGESCHIFSRGGRLFRVTLGQQNVVTEITPRLMIQVTTQFTVPAPGNQVTINITSESAIANNQTLFIDSGQYTVVFRATNQLVIQYVAGAAHATVAVGTPILDSSHTQIIEYRENRADDDFIFMLQAENYALVFGGQHKTVIFDGSQARLAGIQEVPPGELAAYGWGRVWVALPGRRLFVAGNLVFDTSSGSATLNFRDSILKFTDNDFLNEGGAFGVPANSGPINLMQFLALQDNSLGQGPLLVGTTNAVFTVNAPVDRTTWKNLTYPIQTISLLNFGPETPRGGIPSNNDVYFRSQDGVRSFINAHRYFNSPGNTPLSREVTALLDFDTPDLLYFGSGVLANNKVIHTISPYRTTNGITHRGLTVMNLDLLSDLGAKQPPAWEGAYTGLQILQVVSCRVGNTPSVYAWVNAGSEIQLWQLEMDDFYDVAATPTALTRSPIEAWLETRAENFGVPFEKKKLYMGELYVDQIVDNVSIQVQFKPDQYPIWTNWGPPIQLCAVVSQCNPPANCEVLSMSAPGYAARVTLPVPPENCALTKQLVNHGYEMQFRFNVTGHVRFLRWRAHGYYVPTPMQGSDSCTPQVCVTLTSCQTNWFTYSAN